MYMYQNGDTAYACLSMCKWLVDLYVSFVTTIVNGDDGSRTCASVA